MVASRVTATYVTTLNDRRLDDKLTTGRKYPCKRNILVVDALAVGVSYAERSRPVRDVGCHATVWWLLFHRQKQEERQRRYCGNNLVPSCFLPV